MNARSFTFACLLALVISVPQLQAQTVIGSDDFDGGEIFLTRTFDPDLSGNAIPGTWTSNFDVFGIVDRSVNFRFADDTLLDPTFNGIFPSTETDMFFGAMDTVNDENPAGTGVLTYTFDISGQSDLMFSAEFAAFGDFEGADIFEITASIDGSAPEAIISLVAAEDIDDYEYFFEDGVTTFLLDDPMTINGTIVDNQAATFSAPINGTGNTLTIVVTTELNGGSENCAMDNIEIIAGGGGGAVFVPPTDYTVSRGIELTGTLDLYLGSDDMSATYNPGFTIGIFEAPVWLIFDGVAPGATSFRVESNAGTPGLTYTVEAFNWASGQYDIVGDLAETFANDTVGTFAIVADDHIDVGGEVRTRVGWRQTGFTINFPWEVRVDQTGWNE